MEKALQIFSYGSKEVRTIDENGEIWFVAKDVAQALEYPLDGGTGKYFNNVPEIWKRGKRISLRSDKTGIEQAREVLCISEQGLYFFLGRSDKPKALPFQMWLAGEVLPSIRRTGAYVSEQALLNPEFIRGLNERLTAVQEANDELREQIARDQAATTFGKIMLGMQNGLDFHKAAQLLAQQGLPIGRNKLYKLARDIKWLCEQKKIKNQPTQAGIKKGVVGWQSEIIDGHIAEVVVLSNKGFDQILQKLLKEHRPIIYLIDREEAQDRALEAKKAGKQKALA